MGKIFNLLIWPFKSIAKLFFKLFIVNIYSGYLSAKVFVKKFIPKDQNQKTVWTVFLKDLPLIFLMLFAVWIIIDQSKISKLSAEEIGQNTILNQITQSPENFESLQNIIEGPMEKNTTESFSYFETEAVEPSLTNNQSLNQTRSIAGQEDTVLIAPITSGPKDVITRTETIEYTVQVGDTISTIAQKFGISTNTILWANNLSYNSLIRPGQTVKILPVSGIVHTVKSGENLASIAKKYQAETDDIMDFNQIFNASDIQVGDNLIIPDGVKPVTTVSKPQTTIVNIFTPPSATISDTKFQWPTNSQYITQYFGWQHTGLDIGAKTGDAIYAAESGKVERAGWTTGYGYNIIINHGNGLKTLYGHCSKLYVEVGDSVSRGEVIGAIGSTGWSTGPHLHLEIRVNGARVNPLNYIR